MTRKPSVWLACTAGAAVVAAVIVFLVLQGTVDAADKWSSVGGFLTALVTVVVGGVAWFVRRDTESATPSSEDGGRPVKRRWWAILLGNRTVFIGDGQTNINNQRHDD